MGRRAWARAPPRLRTPVTADITEEPPLPPEPVTPNLVVVIEDDAPVDRARAAAKSRSPVTREVPASSSATSTAERSAVTAPSSWVRPSSTAAH